MAGFEWMRNYYDQVEEVWKTVVHNLSKTKATSGKLSYTAFEIKNFKSVKSLTITMADNNLVLLLGLNESGKTTILKAIEYFDYRNDPRDKSELEKMLSDVRNKANLISNEDVVVTATIQIVSSIDIRVARDHFRAQKQPICDEIANMIGKINAKGEVCISRIVPFTKGNHGKSRYEIDTRRLKLPNKEDTTASRLLASYIVRLCPYIMYFEDFQDLPPENIYANQKKKELFCQKGNQNWYDIIGGLFYDTNENIDVSQFMQFYDKKNPRKRDADSVLEQINKNLDREFTGKWKKLSRVGHIARTCLDYDSQRQSFQITIYDKDGSASYVTDRSRGAIWYLGFLMKTEFRCKKMRSDVGKPVYLIDEPASNLHSAAQQQMLKNFSALAENACVIYTTHSQYLVSPDNIKTTYVVQRKSESGTLDCVRLGKYLERKGAQATYYQPIADCLRIAPHSMDMPCKNAVIVEGPSDAAILTVMHKIAMKREPYFAFYPAGGANDMSTLISLNLGWGANFKILLDSDEEGRNAREQYKKKFNLENSYFVDLPDNLPGLEKIFAPEDMKTLCQKFYDAVIDTPTKKHIGKMFARACRCEKTFAAIRGGVQQETVRRFKDIFEQCFADFSK